MFACMLRQVGRMQDALALAVSMGASPSVCRSCGGIVRAMNALMRHQRHSRRWVCAVMRLAIPDVRRDAMQARACDLTQAGDL